MRGAVQLAAGAMAGVSRIAEGANKGETKGKQRTKGPNKGEQRGLVRFEFSSHANWLRTKA